MMCPSAMGPGLLVWLQVRSPRTGSGSALALLGLILGAAGTRLQQGCWHIGNLSPSFCLLQEGVTARQNEERASQGAK